MGTANPNLFNLEWLFMNFVQSGHLSNQDTCPIRHLFNQDTCSISSAQGSRLAVLNGQVVLYMYVTKYELTAT